jgi:hypothetical protein
MKKLALIALAGLLLAGCASVPRPENETDSLVIGSLVLDFTHGFFNQPGRMLDSGVRLDFMNMTSKREFWVITERGGYFYFLSNGGDRYRLVSYSFDVPTGGYGSGQVVYDFASTPHSVQYLGRFEFTYWNPQVSSDKRYWHYSIAKTHENKIDEMLAFLKTRAADSPWPAYETRSEWSKVAATESAPSFFDVARTGTLQAVQDAVSQGADVKAHDANGLTALMYAAMYNQDPQVITVLLKAGADPEVRDKYGWTALMLAARRAKNPEVVTVLLQGGADAKAQDSNGNTALDHAKENENLNGTDALQQLEEASR